MLAEQSKVLAERLLACAAELAGAITDAGVDQHAISRRESAHVASYLVHCACTVGADDPVRANRHPRKPAEHEQIEMIERDGMNAHTHVGRRAERRNGEIGDDLQLLQSAMGGDRERSHGLVAPLY
jgi:hypothetical protein